jgi:hypothetical protein
MLKLLWSHIRNIRVEVFNNKIVYDIPIYSEIIFKYFTYDVEKTSGGLRLTLKPVESLLK